MSLGILNVLTTDCSLDKNHRFLFFILFAYVEVWGTLGTRRTIRLTLSIVFFVGRKFKEQISPDKAAADGSFCFHVSIFCYCLKAKQWQRSEIQYVSKCILIKFSQPLLSQGAYFTFHNLTTQHQRLMPQNVCRQPPLFWSAAPMSENKVDAFQFSRVATFFTCWASSSYYPLCNPLAFPGHGMLIMLPWNGWWFCNVDQKLICI